MDDIDCEWEEADLADLLETYEAMDHAEYLEFMGGEDDTSPDSKS